MRTIKITVNKSEDKPEGIEIEVIEPADNQEQRVLAFLLTGYIRDTASRGILKLDLPEQFSVSYEREGSFVVNAGPQRTLRRRAGPCARRAPSGTSASSVGCGPVPGTRAACGRSFGHGQLAWPML